MSILWGEIVCHGTLRDSSYGRETTSANREKHLLLDRQRVDQRITSAASTMCLANAKNSTPVVTPNEDRSHNCAGDEASTAVMDFPGKKQAQQLRRELLLGTSVIGHWPGSFNAVQSKICSGSSTRSFLSSRGQSSADSLGASSHNSFGNGRCSVFDFQRTATASSARSPRRRNQVVMYGEIGPARICIFYTCH